jgi:hypothetical protein
MDYRLQVTNSFYYFYYQKIKEINPERANGGTEFTGIRN